MTELRVKMHLNLWYIKPERFIDGRKIEIHFLFFTISILKNKQKR